MNNTIRSSLFVSLLFFSLTLTSSVNSEISVSGITIDQIDNTKSFSVYVVADYEFYLAYGVNTITHIESLFDSVNFYYQNESLDMEFWIPEVLVDISNESFVDPVSSSPGNISYSDYLADFNSWRMGNTTASQYDLSLLISGYDFEGGVVGYAYNGVIETSFRSVIVQGIGNADELVDLIITHEIGHMFSATHDGNGNACPNTGFIMSAVLDLENPAMKFSDCSIDEINAFLDTLVGNYIDQFNPAVSDSPDITVLIETEEIILISWVINDTNPFRYRIKQEGIPGPNGYGYEYDWNSNQTVQYEFVKTDLGTFTVTLTAIDDRGNTAVDDVNVTVSRGSSVTVTVSDDLSMIIGETKTIWFNLTDDYNGLYTLLKNGTEVETGSWDQSLDISVDLLNHPIGIYNYTIVVEDVVSAITVETIIVTIEDNTEPPSSTTPGNNSETPSNSNDSSTKDEESGLNPIPISRSFFLLFLLPLLKNYKLRRQSR